MTAHGDRELSVGDYFGHAAFAVEGNDYWQDEVVLWRPAVVISVGGITSSLAIYLTGREFGGLPGVRSQDEVTQAIAADGFPVSNTYDNIQLKDSGEWIGEPTEVAFELGNEPLFIDVDPDNPEIAINSLQTLLDELEEQHDVFSVHYVDGSQLNAFPLDLSSLEGELVINSNSYEPLSYGISGSSSVLAGRHEGASDEDREIDGLVQAAVDEYAETDGAMSIGPDAIQSESSFFSPITVDKQTHLANIAAKYDLPEPAAATSLLTGFNAGRPIPHAEQMITEMNQALIPEVQEVERSLMVTYDRFEDDSAEPAGTFCALQFKLTHEEFHIVQVDSHNSVHPVVGGVLGGLVVPLAMIGLTARRRRAHMKIDDVFAPQEEELAAMDRGDETPALLRHRRNVFDSKIAEAGIDSAADIRNGRETLGRVIKLAAIVGGFLGALTPIVASGPEVSSTNEPIIVDYDHSNRPTIASPNQCGDDDLAVKKIQVALDPAEQLVVNPEIQEPYRYILALEAVNMRGGR